MAAPLVPLITLALAIAPVASQPAKGDVFMAAGAPASAPCTRAAPCGSFQRAFDVARGGDVVSVGDGSYPPQVIHGDKPGTRRITFRAAPGAHVRVGNPGQDCPQGFDVRVSHVVFENLDGLADVCVVGEPEDGRAQSDVTFRDDHGSSFLVDSATDVRVLGGDYGGTPSDQTHHNSGIRKNGPTMPARILIDGATFHDYACTESYCHIECLIVGAVDGLTIRNSHFYSCPIMDVYFETFNGPISHVTFEGDTMADGTEPAGGPGSGRASIEFNDSSTFTGVVIRRNSLRGPLDLEDGGSLPGAVVAQNVGKRGSFPCHRDVTYRDNIWQGGRCAASDRGVPYGYRLDGGRLVVVARQAAGVRRAFDAVASGRPLSSVRRSVGLSSASLKQLIGERAYMGGQYGARGANPRIVSPRTWRAAQKRLRG